ncbi:MAG: aminotransferase class V-fold PLP-dependent enzyme, partial [Pseudomonadota bacterium]
MKKYSPQTRHVHADRFINAPEQGGVHQSTSNSVLFDFEKVEDLESVFQGKIPGHVYSRSSSPSIVGLQHILCDMEAGIASTCFATGMAAISAVFFSLLKQGDHVLVSHYLFGNTRSFTDALADFGIDVTYVDTTDAKQVEDAITPQTRLLFCESIANPGTQVADLVSIGRLCSEKQILFVLDNTMTPSVMLDSKAVNAHLIITSLTKYIAGHGNVLGGVVTDLGTFDWCTFPNIKPKYQVSDVTLWGMTQLRKKGLRDIGGTLAPASAHPISIG